MVLHCSLKWAKACINFSAKLVNERIPKSWIGILSDIIKSDSDTQKVGDIFSNILGNIRLFGFLSPKVGFG